MIGGEMSARTWIAQLPGFDASAMERLEKLVALLSIENELQNLVSAASLKCVWQRHIADSLQLLRFVPRETQGLWLDLGSGGGFPGLALAAFDPKLKITLVESRARRVEWLTRAASVLQLTCVTVEGQKLEHVPTKQHGVITARAFAPMGNLIDLAARFSTSETIWILPKGKSAAEEVLSLDGWRHTFHVEQSVTDAHAGIVVGELAGRKGMRT